MSSLMLAFKICPDKELDGHSFLQLGGQNFSLSKGGNVSGSYIYVVAFFPLLVRANSRALTYVPKPMKLFILRN